MGRLVDNKMKISSFLLSAASVTADLFLPKSGLNPLTATFADAVYHCKFHFDGTLANPREYSQQELLDASHGLDAWIGLYRSSAQWKFFSIEKDSTLFELVDLDVIPFAYNWA